MLEPEKLLECEIEDNTEKSTEKTCIQNDFVVLGTATQKKKRAVKRVMPDWLANPEIVSAHLDDGYSVKKLCKILDPELIEILKSKGIVKLFPIQYNVINWLHKCNAEKKPGYLARDICVSAPTGSGKTLCYVLPIVQHLRKRLVRRVRCLVIVPVQELAAQVYKVMVDYTRHTNLNIAMISAALSFEEEQRSLVEEGEGPWLSKVDIVIATPRRLIRHLRETRGFSLDRVKFFVIDEADHASEWLHYLPSLLSQIPIFTVDNIRSRHTLYAHKLLFSATLSQDPESLSRLVLFDPILFTTVKVFNTDIDVNLDSIDDNVECYVTPQNLKERFVECSAIYKPIALYQLVTMHKTTIKTLVFVNSGDAAHRLALLMKSFLADQNIVVRELSSKLTSKQRAKILDKFAKEEVHILISSDALARGLDIPNVQLVISYDVPKYIKGYIHRIGRTGRAEKSGTAVSIIIPCQVEMFKQMLKSVRKFVLNIEKMDLEDTAYALNYSYHVAKLKQSLRKERREKSIRKKAKN